MKELFLPFLTAGLSASVLILAVILARLALYKAPKRYICLLWLLVGLRLLIPFTVESRLSLQPDQSAVTQLGAVVLPQQQVPAPVAPGQNSDPVTRPSAPLTENAPATAPSTDSLSPDVAAAPDYGVIAAWVWILGAGGMLAYATISYHALKRKLRWAVPLARGVFEDASVRSPFLLGYLKPRIYLPSQAAEYREHILAHERCHIRRGDNWTKLIGFICLALHWYNPMVWLAYSLLSRDTEMACDEAVIRTMDTQQRKAYSAALLSCAAGRQRFSACPVAFGEDNVKQRILKVLHYKKPAFWLSILAVVAVIAIAVCFLTNPANQTDPTEPSDMDPVEKCRQAVMQLQNADYYTISQDQKRNTTDDVWYAWYTSFHLRNGDNWYHRFESSEWVGEYFAYDGHQFAKNTTSTMPEEDIAYFQWTETDLSNEMMLQHFCWLLEYDWDANTFTLKEISPAKTTITLSVEPRYDSVLSEELQFYFDDVTGRLESVSRMQLLVNGVSLSTVYIHHNDEADIKAILSNYYQRILSGEEIATPPASTAFAAMLTQPSAAEYEAYKSFFYNQLGGGDKVIFADVTRDGKAEMLMVRTNANGDFYYGSVFTIDASGVRLIYSNSGGADHASGYYGWYLKPAENGYNLAEETFGMNNGIGTLIFEEYYLRPDDRKVSVDRIYVSSDDPESRDETGAVSEEAMDRYTRQLNERIAAFYLIHNTYTESNGKYLHLDDAVWVPFE